MVEKKTKKIKFRRSIQLAKKVFSSRLKYICYLQKKCNPEHLKLKVLGKIMKILTKINTMYQSK